VGNVCEAPAQTVGLFEAEASSPIFCVKVRSAIDQLNQIHYLSSNTNFGPEVLQALRDIQFIDSII
jgi:hypothetical protein